jgi:hypothetical protein
MLPDWALVGISLVQSIAIIGEYWYLFIWLEWKPEMSLENDLD